jgi:alpha-tubulin suppressor-like RCC1 family protein
MALVLKADGQTVTGVAGGGDHSLYIKNDGSLWGTGQNSYGELGDGTFGQPPDYSTNQPEQVVADSVMRVTAGFTHSLFIKTNGSLWAMGNNGFGQLGDGSTNGGDYKVNLPEQIIASNVTAVAAGAYHSLFRKSDGSLWGMGYNGDGELGNGTFQSTNLPLQIVASNVIKISAGYTHSLFLKGDGSLWGMGYNGDGELGDGTYGSPPDYCTNVPELIVASNVVAIAAGRMHSIFLKNNGSLWAMGGNFSGQLGNGSYDNTNRPQMIVASNVVAIAAGYDHSLFIKNDGSLWAMGGNQFGQLGDGTFAEAPYFSTNQPEQIVAGNVTAIAAVYAYSLFIKSDGSLWGMGYNYYGQLGDGTQNDANLPEQIFPRQAIANPLPLQIQLTGTNVNLLWPASLSNLVLEVTSSLTPPVVWTAVTNSSVVVNPEYKVILPISVGSRFYCLFTNIGPTGSLLVNLLPPSAVSGGALWNVDGGAWQTNNATVSSLALGSHTVAFSSINGWNTPASVSVLISNNTITVTNGIYVQQPGSLLVNIAPSPAVSQGAAWRVDGGAWQGSGTSVSGLTVGTHTVTYIPLAGWTNPASQSVFIFANQPTVTNATFILVNDSLRPTNQIISPTASQSVSNASFTVVGKASDNVFVGNVFYQLNSTGWNPATTTNNWTNWTANVTLIPDTNVLQAYTVDVAGNFSPTNTVSFVCVLNTPLTVRTNGLGSITPNDDGVPLTIGKVYSLTASVGTGFVFSNWTGGINFPQTVLTNGPTVKFTMQSNLWLQANLTDNTKPTLSVTSPKTGSKATNVLVNVVGTAKDNWNVRGVWCQVNGGIAVPANTANSYSNWTANVSVNIGLNSIKSYAQDIAGNFSTTNNLSISR